MSLQWGGAGFCQARPGSLGFSELIGSGTADFPASSDGASFKGSGHSPLWDERFQSRLGAHPLADLSPQFGVVRRLQ